jgi:hypothetical protein
MNQPNHPPSSLPPRRLSQRPTYHKS